MFGPLSSFDAFRTRRPGSYTKHNTWNYRSDDYHDIFAAQHIPVTLAVLGSTAKLPNVLTLFIAFVRSAVDTVALGSNNSEILARMLPSLQQKKSVQKMRNVVLNTMF